MDSKESNETDTTEGQELELGDKVLMSQTYSTFTTEKKVKGKQIL